MPGRIIYRHPELHNDCGWVFPVILSKRVIAQIEAIIGRSLDDKEIALISKSLAHIRAIRVGFKEVSNQDVKRTLASFLKLSEIEAIEAYRQSDGTTELLIDEALFSFADLHACPSGRDIKKAARIASENLAPGSPAHIKGYRRLLARFTLNLWDNFGMLECRPWQHPDYSPPASGDVLLMLALSEIIDENDKKLQPKDAVALLKEQKNNG